MSTTSRGLRAAVKITDVATAAGVAPMTVSRVINTPERVSEDTARRVRDAIARLGYVPNLIAGGLSSRRSRTVAAVVPTIAHPMFVGMVQSFSADLRAAGYEVALSLSGYADEDDADQLRAILGRRPDAVLVTGATRTPLTRRMLRDCGVPVVEIWDVSPRPIDCLVGFDHADVGATVAAFLHGKGHTMFAAFAAADSRAMTRRRGFVDAARAAGGTVLCEETLPAPSTIEGGRAAMRALVPRLPSPPGRVALFCSSDLVAFGALTEARLHGIDVPGRLAVCGFGDFELSRQHAPAFTTVSAEGGTIGTHAASFLLDRLAGGKRAHRVRVPFRIVERETT